MQTWKRFEWMPGNGTRYDLIYGGGGEKALIAWMHAGGSGGKIMMFTQFLHYSYIMEKMQVNIADAVGILKFLEYHGHDVGYPPEDEVYEMCTGAPIIRELV